MGESCSSAHPGNSADLRGDEVSSIVASYLLSLIINEKDNNPPTGLNIADEDMVMKITPVDSIWRVTIYIEKRLV